MMKQIYPNIKIIKLVDERQSFSHREKDDIIKTLINYHVGYTCRRNKSKQKSYSRATRNFLRSFMDAIDNVRVSCEKVIESRNCGELIDVDCEIDARVISLFKDVYRLLLQLKKNDVNASFYKICIKLLSDVDRYSKERTVERFSELFKAYDVVFKSRMVIEVNKNYSREAALKEGDHKCPLMNINRPCDYTLMLQKAPYYETTLTEYYQTFLTFERKKINFAKLKLVNCGLHVVGTKPVLRTVEVRKNKRFEDEIRHGSVNTENFIITQFKRIFFIHN